MTALSTFILGFALAAGFGVAHHFALSGIRAIAPHERRHAKTKVVVTFLSLLTLHTAELSFLAVLNHQMIENWFPEAFGGAERSITDTLYLTGIAFTTLGYSSLEAAGAYRLLLMFQSLLGFMLLTWSATFLFSACQKSWQQDEE